jgi:hypothetical protein
MNRCTISQPALFNVDGANHHAACFLYDNYGEKGDSSANEPASAPHPTGVQTNANP